MRYIFRFGFRFFMRVPAGFGLGFFDAAMSAQPRETGANPLADRVVPRPVGFVRSRRDGRLFGVCLNLQVDRLVKQRRWMAAVLEHQRVDEDCQRQ